ncbi:MAG TPA: DNA-binding protein, partial [Roseiarcus sp.]|nr:DNA-binding protein [Roseiarcus sp.]
RLAEALDLDMVAAGWRPTVETYLGRVAKARILDAVREAKGERAAQRIDHLKKREMAEKAEEMLAGSGWLPEALRTRGRLTFSPDSEADLRAIGAEESAGVESVENGQETAMAETQPLADDEGAADASHAQAAE